MDGISFILDGAGRGREDAANGLHQGGLSRTIGPDKGNNLPLFYVQGYAP